eukprot:Nk52_evm12s2402 gene=Nk52_evmTU12s2402
MCTAMSRLCFSSSVICIAFYGLLLCATLQATASPLRGQGKVQPLITDIDAADVKLSEGLGYEHECHQRCLELDGEYTYNRIAGTYYCASTNFETKQSCEDFIGICGGYFGKYYPRSSCSGYYDIH